MHIFQSHLVSNNLSNIEHDYFTFKSTPQPITFRKCKNVINIFKNYLIDRCILRFYAVNYHNLNSLNFLYTVQTKATTLYDKMYVILLQLLLFISISI